MDLPNNYLKKFVKGSSNSSKDKELTKEIYQWSNKQISFGMVMKLIKKFGYQKIWEMNKEVRQVGIRSSIGLFLWKVKELYKK